MNDYLEVIKMEFKGKTIQEHIWNSLEEVSEYSTWDWVTLFEHFELPMPINDENYGGWVKELKLDKSASIQKLEE